MTATKYNSKHRIVDEDVRDAQRRARAVAVAEERTRLLHARLLEVRPSVSTRSVPHELTLAVVRAQNGIKGAASCVIRRHVLAWRLRREDHQVRGTSPGAREKSKNGQKISKECPGIHRIALNKVVFT